jgi:hypothetical protein
VVARITHEAGTTLAEDAKSLAGLKPGQAGSTQEAQRLALQFRMEKKKILAAALKSLGAA